MIRFENVGLRYGLGQEVLRDVSFHLLPGSFHFLTGSSGAGKTSLLRMLFLSLKPSRGIAYMFGKNVTQVYTRPARRAAPADRHRVPGLPPARSYDDLGKCRPALRVHGKRQSEYAEDVTELLKWVGLGERMHAYPPVLSGGEKQRAAIARAVIGKPELLLADEPTGNVDPQMARRLLRLFIELNRLGTSVIIATHDYQLMTQFAAPRLMLENGRMHIHG